MKVLVDMNLSPAWAEFLTTAGHAAEHWSHLGDGDAQDDVLMAWALARDQAVFANDLDFGAALALTFAKEPSVLQVPTQNLNPAQLGPLILRLLRDHEEALRAGALVVVDEHKAQVRWLPLRR